MGHETWTRAETNPRSSDGRACSLHKSNRGDAVLIPVRTASRTALGADGARFSAT